MRALLAAAAIATLGSGCIIVPTPHQHSSAVSSQRCPPGHQWSDGRCHARGRGHDQEKHER